MACGFVEGQSRCHPFFYFCNTLNFIGWVLQRLNKQNKSSIYWFNSKVTKAMINTPDITIQQTTITAVVQTTVKQSTKAQSETFMNANLGSRINGVTNWESLRANGVITGLI